MSIVMKNIVFLSLLLFLGILSGCTISNDPFDKGLRAFEAGDYSAAHLEWQRASNAGDVRALHSLAWLNETEDYDKADIGTAVTLYNEAAALGHPPSQFNLGRLYDNGKGVPKNFETAAGYYLDAADAGLPEAQGHLGDMYRKGHGVDQDFNEAFRWLSAAAEQNYSPAQNTLGVMYFKGEGTVQSYAKAFYWFERAVRNRLPESELNRSLTASFLTEEQIEKIKDQIDKL